MEGKEEIQEERRLFKRQEVSEGTDKVTSVEEEERKGKGRRGREENQRRRREEQERVSVGGRYIKERGGCLKREG